MGAMGLKFNNSDRLSKVEADDMLSNFPETERSSLI